MDFFKTYKIVFIPTFIFMLFLSIGADGFSIGTIFISIFLSLLITFLIVGYTFALFLLYDSGKWYYQIFAVLTGGLIGLIVLLGVRWVYRKAGFTFFD